MTDTQSKGLARDSASMKEQEATLKAFGELEVGDRILGGDGRPVKVSATYAEHIPERMYEIELENGVIIEASGNHLWYIEPQSDVLSHSQRVINARKLLKLSGKTWEKEALSVAESDEHFEIGVEDLMNFFDFIEDASARAHFIQRICASLGHIVEEQVDYSDYFTHETTAGEIEYVYDARRFFQQALAITGRKAYRRWPVIVGRVVTTDVLVARYPDADLPTLDG